MKATIGRMLSSETSSAALKIPIASATPVMISHSGLVCLPAAGNAAAAGLAEAAGVSGFAEVLREAVGRAVLALGGRSGRCFDPDLLAERLVDVDQHLLLPLGDLGVGHDRVGDGGLALPVVEYAGLNVERLGRDPQALRDLLQDVGARPAQPAFDLAQVRVRHARSLGQLADRDLGLLALLADVGTDGVDVDRAHIASLTSSAC